MAILSSAHYDQIRAALDLSLDEMSLPDDVIGQDIYLGRAETDVTTVFADAETFSGANKLRVQRAVILFTAAYLAPAVVAITSRSVTAHDSNFARRPFDPEKRAVELKSQGQAELGAVEDQDADASVVIEPHSIVAVVPGRRGWYTGNNWGS